MRIKEVKASRINSVDFSNLPFGRSFSDHMLVCNYRNGNWETPEILPYGPIQMSLGSQVLHYGQSVFEGMKAFKNSKNEILFFRRERNFLRLNKSAIRMAIPEIPKDIFMNGLDELIRLDHQWCKLEEGFSLYIRPFIFASSECVKASSSEEFKFVIITLPTTTYYPGKLNLLIEERFTRASQGGVGFAKAAGNYAATFYPTKLANSKGFQQIIWTDANEHQYIEECGTMNIFFRIGAKIVTPKISETILDGVTRNSVITIARDLGIEVEETKVSVSDLLDAHSSGILKEVFGTGTAVSISPVSSFTFRENKVILPDVEDSYALKLKKELIGIQKGRVLDTYNWTSKLI